MTKKEMKGLREGDILQGKASGLGYIVTGNNGATVTAVRTVEVSNPDEWVLITKRNGNKRIRFIRP